MSANELHQSSTRYCTQLQEYNANLQTDAQATSEQLKGLQVNCLASTGSPPMHTATRKHFTSAELLICERHVLERTADVN